MDLMADQDFRNVLNTIIREILAALPSVTNDARDTLKKHIDEDVYTAYSPKVYKRRKDNGELGKPLNDMAAYVKIIPPGGGNVGGKLMVTSKVYYTPSGEHKVKKWNTSDGNGLIGRIESKDPAYTWGNKMVPVRPFWQQFIDEMVDGGEFEKSFVRAMSASEKIVADGNVVEDQSDREY